MRISSNIISQRVCTVFFSSIARVLFRAILGLPAQKCGTGATLLPTASLFAASEAGGDIPARLSDITNAHFVAR